MSEKKKAIVICGFPGVGKSVFYRKYKDKIRVLDSDSSKFSWIGDPSNKERSCNFPENYIEHIKENLYEADIILVSTHEVVIDCLTKNNIDHYIVIPAMSSKEEYRHRYEERESPEEFIRHIMTNWEAFISNIYTKSKSRVIQLRENETLEDVVLSMVNTHFSLTISTEDAFLNLCKILADEDYEFSVCPIYEKKLGNTNKDLCLTYKIDIDLK